MHAAERRAAGRARRRGVPVQLAGAHPSRWSDGHRRADRRARRPAGPRAARALSPRAASPVRAVHYLDVRQSMHNGGGPACLRLRVPLTGDEAGALGANVVATDALLDALGAWVDRHYRDRAGGGRPRRPRAGPREYARARRADAAARARVDLRLPGAGRSRPPARPALRDEHGRSRRFPGRRRPRGSPRSRRQEERAHLRDVRRAHRGAGAGAGRPVRSRRAHHGQRRDVLRGQRHRRFPQAAR